MSSSMDDWRLARKRARIIMAIVRHGDITKEEARDAKYHDEWLEKCGYSYISELRLWHFTARRGDYGYVHHYDEAQHGD